ncbi:MAG: transcription termination factor Rho [Clostridia bacterium]|nr:transcription termination factor Rho [Clostridia bacterium]
MSEKFEKMTVLELRRVAKEMGVKLGAGISKQGIVDKLAEAEAAQGSVSAAPAEAPAPEMPRPVRSAAIITDDESDEDDIPVLTPNAGVQPASRPVSRPAPAAPAGGASSLSGISSKAPAFTMEGSRAWHNPRANMNPGPSYQRAPQAWGAPRPAAGAADNRGYSRPGQLRPDPRMQQTRAPSYPSRFGPDTAAQPENGDYRAPAYAPAPPQDYQPRNDYQSRDYQPRAEMPPARESVPAPYNRPAAPAYYQKDGASPAPAPAMPDLMAAGECGDGEGVLEVHPEGYGFLRTAHYRAGKNDIYVANAQIRRFNLRSGDYIAGKTRPQREGDKYSALLYITEINGRVPEENPTRAAFDSFTAIFPKRRIMLSQKNGDPALRLIDLLSPIGFGQRALISAGPKTGKTALMKKMAAAIHENHPKAHLMVLLIDERPEDVTAMKEEIKGEVIDSTFDEPAESHAKTCELALERAMRLVEMKKDVVILTDNLTRLSRACHALAPQSARAMEGGLAAGAMNKPKKFFGAARNTKEGGTLTIIATILTNTGSILDDAILDEMQGTANMEMMIARQQGEKRIAPVLQIDSMRTRHDQLLLTERERALAAKIREMKGLDEILPLLLETKNNEELADRLLGPGEE